MPTEPFGVYVHVPFCQTRCGYCDFNTYTATELGGGASRESYAALAIGEVRLAAKVLARAGCRLRAQGLRPAAARPSQYSPAPAAAPRPDCAATLVTTG